MSLVRTCTFKVTRALGYATYITCVLHCVAEYVIDFALCIGPSMEPTIHSKNVVLFEHLSVFQQKVDRGDIVITKSLSNPKQIICKRVKAIPGDRVRSGFFSETKLLQQIKSAVRKKEKQCNHTHKNVELIPKGHVWLEGDNKDNSFDSRIYGPIPQGLIMGRVLLIIWPFSNFRKLTKMAQQNT